MQGDHPKAKIAPNKKELNLFLTNKDWGIFIEKFFKKELNLKNPSINNPITTRIIPPILAIEFCNTKIWLKYPTPNPSNIKIRENPKT